MSLFSKLLLVSAVLGLLAPALGVALKDYVIVFLSVSVVFALLASKSGIKFTVSGLQEGLLYGYVVLTGAMLLFSLFMPSGIREGIILYAIFPPAVSVIALSAQWEGKIQEVFGFQLVSYAASVVLVPLASLYFIGESVNPMVIVQYLIFTFIVPAAIALIVKVENKKPMSDLAGVFLALVFYVVIAKSQAWIVGNWQSMLAYAFPLALMCLGITLAVYKFTKNPDAVVHSLLKNGGAAAAVSIATLPPAATAIISAKTFIDVILILVAGELFRKGGKI